MSIIPQARPDMPPEPTPIGAAVPIPAARSLAQAMASIKMKTGPLSYAEFSKEVREWPFTHHANITFDLAAAYSDVPVGETVILDYVAAEGQRCSFTGSGFTIPGHEFIPYKDVFHIDWPFNGANAKIDYANYLEISFHDRPSITFRVGNYCAVSLGNLINGMQLLTASLVHKSPEPNAC
jgi:hypothetical protein